jgi:hypothetical protein
VADERVGDFLEAGAGVGGAERGPQLLTQAGQAGFSLLSVLGALLDVGTIPA